MLGGSVVSGVPGWRVEVRVNGVVRACRSVSFDSEMAGDLPDQVVASGGVGGVSGTIAWAAQGAVQSRPVSPWAKVANWPPSPGDLVQVRVSDGVTWWNRFTGVIDKTSGSPDGGFESSVIDFRDRITGTFTHEPLLRHMVPMLEDGAYRSIGLRFWYPVMMALRSCGFNNVPPGEANTAVGATLQGSVWPSGGTLRDAQGLTPGTHAAFHQAPWGYAAGGFVADYMPRLNESSSVPVQVTCVVSPNSDGTAYTDVYYGQVTIRLRVNADRSLAAHYNDGSGWTTNIVSLSVGAAGSYTIATLLVKDGTWTLRTNGGGNASTSRTVAAGTMSLVRIDATENARMAGVQVSHPNSSSREFASLGFVPNVRFTPSNLASTMDMMPALRGRSVRDLVDEILSATLTAAWWDEDGVLVLRPSDILRVEQPSWTINSGPDITSLSWEDSLLAVRSGVHVKWRNPAISKGRQWRLELWRGPEESLASDSDPIEHFVEPPSGAEWFGVDRAVRRLDSTNWGAYNSRRGSYAGFWYSDSDGDELPTTVAAMGLTIDALYADSLKITTQVNGMSSTTEANTATSPSATSLRAQFRGEALPVIRGMGRGEWVDDTYVVSVPNPSAPALEHDLGYWGHEYFEGGSVAQRIGDYLAQMVTAPQPTIPDLGVVYDPRRQVGDVYMIRSEWLGIELRALVVGISESHDGGSTQSLTVRIIAVTSIRPVTYDDLAAAWGTGNYAGLQAAWTALTYNDFAADPLEGAPA